MKSILFFFLLGTLSGSIAFAASTSESPCGEYTRLFRVLSGEILTLTNSQPKLKFIEPGTLARNAAHLQCEVSDQIKHTVWSEQGKSKLYVQQWLKLSILDKLRLVTHEIAVMSGLEADGQYSQSNKITALLSLHSEKYTDLMSAQSILRKDQLVTYIHPFVIFEGRRLPIGYQGFADVDEAYFPLSKEERKGNYASARQSVPRNHDLQLEFCRLQGMNTPKVEGLTNTQRYSLRDDKQKLDPPLEVVPANFELAWIDQGKVKLQKLFTRATGQVHFYETITCEQSENNP